MRQASEIFAPGWILNSFPREPTSWQFPYQSSCLIHIRVGLGAIGWHPFFCLGFLNLDCFNVCHGHEWIFWVKSSIFHSCNIARIKPVSWLIILRLSLHLSVVLEHWPTGHKYPDLYVNWKMRLRIISKMNQWFQRLLAVSTRCRTRAKNNNILALMSCLGVSVCLCVCVCVCVCVCYLSGQWSDSAWVKH